MPARRNKPRTDKSNYLKRRTYQQGKAEVDAAHKVTFRLYADALRLWRRCTKRRCKRHRRCLPHRDQGFNVVGFRLIHFAHFHRALCAAIPAPDEGIITNPQTYPQTHAASVFVCFNLRLSVRALSSLPDRSRLVLPNVSIAKVRLAWVRRPLPSVAPCGEFDPGSEPRVAALGT